MLYVGLDLSRTRVDVHVLNENGESVEVTAVASDAGGLRSLVDRLRIARQPVRGVIESMNGARFVHDQLELAGWGECQKLCVGGWSVTGQADSLIVVNW